MKAKGSIYEKISTNSKVDCNAVIKPSINSNLNDQSNKTTEKEDNYTSFELGLLNRNENFLMSSENKIDQKNEEYHKLMQFNPQDNSPNREDQNDSSNRNINLTEKHNPDKIKNISRTFNQNLCTGKKCLKKNNILEECLRENNQNEFSSVESQNRINVQEDQKYENQVLLENDYDENILPNDDGSDLNKKNLKVTNESKEIVIEEFDNQNVEPYLIDSSDIEEDLKLGSQDLEMKDQILYQNESNEIENVRDSEDISEKSARIENDSAHFKIPNEFIFKLNDFNKNNIDNVQELDDYANYLPDYLLNKWKDMTEEQRKVIIQINEKEMNKIKMKRNLESTKSYPSVIAKNSDEKSTDLLNEIKQKMENSKLCEELPYEERSEDKE